MLADDVPAIEFGRALWSETRQMADFEVYIDDDRYSVPSLYLITAQTDARARAVAEELLVSSDHHQGVELRRGGERIFGLGSYGPSGLGEPDHEESPCL